MNLQKEDTQMASKKKAKKENIQAEVKDLKDQAEAKAESKAKEAGPRTKEAEKIEKKINRSERSVKEYQSFILRLGAFILAIWLLFFVVIGIMHMPSEDMYPRIDAGDFILYYRLDTSVKAQDIIVIEKTTDEGRGVFVSRVVAVAGDTVEITEDNRLCVNGNIMIERNIFYSTAEYPGYVEYPLTLKEGECFVLADSRNGGTDSRYFGPVQKDEICGTVITIIRRNNL